MLKKNIPTATDALEFTGERYTPEIGGSIELEHLHRYLLARRLATGKTVLDIACGEGYGSAMLAKVATRVYGVDISLDAVEHAQIRYGTDNLYFRVGSAAAIPLEDSSVDIVVSFETIEHHAEHESMLREIKRVLKPGGLMVLSSPDKLECTDKTGYTNPHHVKELYHEEFTNLVQSYFTNVRLFGQRVLYASAILPEAGHASLRSYHITNDHKKGAVGVAFPLFHIAFASDSALPDIEGGLLEQSIADIEELRIKDMRIAELQRQADSYRVFRTRPVYFILRAIYRRSRCLQRLRNAFNQLREKVKGGEFSIRYAKDNPSSLAAMADRRFAPAAIKTAVLGPAPSEWPELDISIVTYNSERWLDAFFASLMSQRYPLSKLHLSIVDNGSTDDTVSRLESFLTKNKTAFASASVTKQTNKGFGAGHDKALRNGKSAYCLVTNVDVEFLPDSLCNVMRTALVDTDGVVGSWELRQYPYEHPKHYDPVTLETSWSAHACVLLRRSAYERCGGYDPAIFMYAEDVELSYRLRSFGYTLKYVPSAAIMHYAYDDISVAKPAQYIGSIVGNLYVRMRYGDTRSFFGGLLQSGYLLLRPGPFKGARRMLSKQIFSLLPSVPGIRSMKGSEKSFFPFRGLDYEMRRDDHVIETFPLSLPEKDVPRVSVLIRTYKGRGFLLRQAIQTVFNQTYPALELIVSEDGGDTQRGLVIDMARSAPTGIDVHYLANPKQGRSATGNTALRHATAPYFVFLDDDDLLYADHIETLMRALLKHPECPVAYAPGMEVVTDVFPTDECYTEKGYRCVEVLHQSWDYSILQEKNFLVISALVKRELYLERGGLDTELEMLEDWNLWLRYGNKNSFAYTPKTTMLFRTPANSNSALKRSQAIHAAYDHAKQRALLFADTKLDN